MTYDTSPDGQRYGGRHLTEEEIQADLKAVRNTATMSDPTNAERSERAFRTVLIYRQYQNEDKDYIETGITDLVTDLLHLCDDYGIDQEELLLRCEHHYSAERVKP